ncbi:Golgi-to-ER vesicle coat component [Tulasnella sp. 403]|nr:Golgi-to-ER vesicle coat component [Tulasnella sp. 403]
MAVNRFKLVFFVPRQSTQAVLSHLFTLSQPSTAVTTSAVAQTTEVLRVGRIGAYDGCAFVSPGTGQYVPLEGANPTIGKVGQPEFVEEDRVETLVTGTAEKVKELVTELKKCHPYEEPAYDPNLSLYTTTAFIVLDTDGNRVLAKYYNNKNSGSSETGGKSLSTLKDQRAYEKALWEKTKKPGGDIILYDTYLAVYRHSLDLIFYLLGPTTENELMLNSALVAFFDALSILLRNQVEKRSVLDNLDVVLLCLDETIDDGIIVETDSTAIASRVSRPRPDTTDIVINEQTIMNAYETVKARVSQRIF